MCGISGIVGIDDKKLLKDMCDVIYHRGPDDSGIFLDRKIGLGIRRLSIIDVKGGHQPIHNEDESIWVVFNGEIYNFLELKKDLEVRGHKFYTNSDTEVIVHLYEEYEDECPKKLRGMFAFAIWDNKNKKLFLARDRLGKKPLYYTISNGIFLFGSEIKSILQYDEIVRKVDFRALDYFLTFRYIPGPMTMFDGIKKLQPGSTLMYKDGKIETKKYWDITFLESTEKSEEYYIKNLMNLMKESVKIRLMSEVPLGAYLSGGTDSSSIVGIMSEFLDEPVKTFTVGFGDERFDELKPAKTIAEAFGTDHHEFIVNPTDLKLLPKIIWHFDEPIADPAAIPTFLLSELAKKYVTVVLTGEGGDEMFAGYEQYKIMSNFNRYKVLMPKIVRCSIMPWLVKVTPKNLLNSFFKYSSALGEEGINRFSKYLKSMDDIGRSYLEIVSIFDEDEKNDLYTEETKLANKGADVIKYTNEIFNSVNKNILNKLLLFETKKQLPDNLLMKVDKMTMGFSIEARSPFLDQKLVEFSATIPPKLKLKGFNDKYILRKAMNKIIPKSIIKRGKQRFFVPIDLWFEGELGEIVRQVFSENNIKKRGYFKHESISHIIQNHGKSKLFFSRQLWNLLTLEIWHRVFIDSDNLNKKNLSLDKILQY